MHGQQSKGWAFQEMKVYVGALAGDGRFNQVKVKGEDLLVVICSMH